MDNRLELTEAEERKRIAVENEKLKKEAEQKAKKDEAERKRLEKEKRDLTEKLRLSAIDFLFKNGFENTHGGMQAKKYHHFIGANHYSEFDTEKEFELFKKDVVSSKEKSELKAKEDAERKAKEEEAEKLQAELNKGDAAKVKDLTDDLEALKTKYSFKSAKNTKMYEDVGLLIDKVVNHIKNK